jgi:minor curlin subunit
MKCGFLSTASMAILIGCCSVSGSAHAQTISSKTVVSLNGTPVTVNQNSQINLAGVFEIGGTTVATVNQTGGTNVTGVLQFGGTNVSSVTQTGFNNSNYVGQSGK